MDNSISPDLEKRMHDLCDDIASAESLSSELHEELYTHIEDKMLGYLNGEEALSEADAYLLAREHFGNRDTVREQLATMHPVSSIPTLPQRLIIPVILFVALNLVFSLSMKVIHLLFPWFLAETPIMMIFPLIFVATCIWVNYDVLNRWKHQVSTQQSVWYQDWSTGKLVRLLVVIVIAGKFILLCSDVVLLKTFYRSASNVEILVYPFWEKVFTIGVLPAWILWANVGTRSKKNFLQINTPL